MINSKKKGFTIVELVIVIAVIAVLAAVLIPTFSNLVKKANMSADQQAVRQMNTVLVMADSKKELETFNDAQLALAEAGYNALESLTPISTGYKFYWLNEHDCIVLADKDNKVVFPENLTDLDLGKAIAELNATNLKNAAEEIKAEVSTEAALIEAIKKGQEITLTNDVVISEVISITSDTIINLGEFKISAPTVGRPFTLFNGVTLTINAEESNKTIDCGKYGIAKIESGSNANLIINGGSFVADTDKGAFIKLVAGSSDINVTLNNVTYTDNGDYGYLMNIQGFAGKLNLTVNGGSYESAFGFQTSGSVTIKDTTIKTKGYALMVAGDATIEGCSFELENKYEEDGGVPAAAVFVCNQGKAKVNNCVVNGTAKYGLMVVNTGGTIIATNNTINVENKYVLLNSLDEGASALITVDGVEIVNQ